MNNGTVRFTCTALSGTGKEGILKPDANGYYKMAIGGLNIINSAGMYYEYEGAKELFEQSSQLMRRVKRGALRSELGHPQRRPGESMDDFVNRYITINEANTCAHIAEISLNFKDYKDRNGKPIIAIIGDVCPSGPHGEQLRKSFDNPKENVCFSIRAFTYDYPVRGVMHRILKNVITFDNVVEPGLWLANKFDSPALESLLDKSVTKEQLTHAIQTPMASVAMESAGMNAAELFKSLNWSLPAGETPIFNKW